jgi:hypothetical protein
VPKSAGRFAFRWRLRYGRPFSWRTGRFEVDALLGYPPRLVGEILRAKERPQAGRVVMGEAGSPGGPSRL